jgi:hypothetical protein
MITDYDNVCCLRLSLSRKNIGEADAQNLAKGLQYYADIQKLE